MDIGELIKNADCVAITLTQALEPMEGWQVPVFPPTYPASDKSRGHRHDTPYTLNVLKDGTKTVTLDSVQSQANRMEASFHGELQDWVPQVRLKAGDRALWLTELPHRLADASIRASELGPEVHSAFEAYDAGDPLPMAQLGPTALIYGAWDSRDTRINVPRSVRSEIHATDVDVFTRSAQFSGAFSREELGFTEKEWRQGAEIGFAPTPSVDQHGGVLIHGQITQTATIHVGALRRLDSATPGLGLYLLTLALGGLWIGGRDYTLRTGCWLVPKEPPVLNSVMRDGQRASLAIDRSDIDASMVEAHSRTQELKIPCGHVRDVSYEAGAGKRVVKTTPTDE